ncbi:hypothetical protein H8D64_01080, partial [PVC group bacterium]|nr:hypothetical protein [PVC group bacterium]
YALNGLGSSVVPIDAQQNPRTVFFSRASTAKDLPLWRALVGSDPRELAAHRYLPATTVFARSSTAELKALWALVRPAIRALAPP